MPWICARADMRTHTSITLSTIWAAAMGGTGKVWSHEHGRQGVALLDHSIQSPLPLLPDRASGGGAVLCVVEPHCTSHLLTRATSMDRTDFVAALHSALQLLQPAV